MSDLRKAAEMALGALEDIFGKEKKDVGAINALRQALAQPEQEPVAWGMPNADGLILDVICSEEHAREPGNYTIPLYTAPPKREWVGLTDTEIIDISRTTSVYGSDNHYEVLEFVASIEAKLKEKNT
jgi:hypothetical protein